MNIYVLGFVATYIRGYTVRSHFTGVRILTVGYGRDDQISIENLAQIASDPVSENVLVLEQRDGSPALANTIKELVCNGKSWSASLW